MNHLLTSAVRVVLWVATIAAAAHAQDVPPATSRRLASADSILHQLVSGTPEEISRRLGKPRSTSREETVNIHDRSHDTLVFITYPKASVRLYHDVQARRYLPALLELSDVHPLKSVGIDSHSSESDLVRLLGKPSRREGGRDAVLVYASGDEGQNAIEFHVSRGRLAKVVYLPYLD